MSLTLRYALNGASADMGVDSSGSSLDMSNVGVVAHDDSEHGGVGYFDGASYLDLTDTPSTVVGAATRCVSVWVNPSEASRILFSSGDETTPGGLLRVSMNDSSQVLVEYSSLTASSTTTPLTLGSWSHVLVMYNGTNVQCYVNGSLEFDDARPLFTASTTFSVGRDSSKGATSAFGGYMADFRLYNNSLDGSDVSDLYTYGPNEIFNLDSTSLSEFPDDGIQGDVVANEGAVAVGNVTTRGLTLIAEKEGSGDTSLESFVYLHDDATSERVLISRRVHTVDDLDTACVSTLQLGSVDSADARVVQDCITYSGESVAIHSVSAVGDENTATMNFDGLSFDSDEASVVLGPSSQFRIKYDNDKDTLQIQHLESTGYVTKVEYGR